MIVSCGHDENGRYRGGAAGDQTGTEYYKRSWYRHSSGWDCVLRYPDRKVGDTIADIAEKSAANNQIGYDQNERLTYFNALKAAGWHPEKITTACESDCSASTAATVIAAGYQTGIAGLQKVSPSCWTGNLKAALKAAGFEVLTTSKYLASDKYLLPGDIILNEKSHVVINVTTGSCAGGSAMSSVYTGTVNVKTYLMVRTGPASSYPAVECFPCGLPKGAKVGIDKEQNGWGRLAGTTWWVSLSYITK